MPFQGTMQFFLLFPTKNAFFNHFKNFLLTKKADSILTQTFIINSIGSKVKSHNYSTHPDSTVNDSGGL